MALIEFRVGMPTIQYAGDRKRLYGRGRLPQRD